MSEQEGYIIVCPTCGKVHNRSIMAESRTHCDRCNTEIVCKEMINKDTDITVYKNGYVLYVDIYMREKNHRKNVLSVV